jgi:competence protein ComEC
MKVESFFKRCPALTFSLFFLLGLAFSVRPSFSLLVPLIAITLLHIKKPIKLIPLFTLFALAFSYGKVTEPTFPLLTEEISGTSLFIVDEIKEKKSHFKTSYLLKGTLHGLDNSYKVPCSISLPPDKKPAVTSQYLLTGSVIKKDERFLWNDLPGTSWKEVPQKFSLLKWRFQIKKYLSKKIQKGYKNPYVSNFLIALTLGELNDSLLRFSFNQLGLQHILAISGFHFGLLSLFLGRFFKLFLKEKKSLVALALFLSSYFLLIGAAPSILRAYLAIILYLIGDFFNKRPNPLNILGVVLILELLLQPGSIKNLGFQMSFLATGAILLLLPITQNLLEKLFPVRSKSSLKTFPILDKGGYFFCCFLRSALALNLAVHVVMVPVCLFYFGSFPLASCIYNLFIPGAISISLLLLLLSPLSSFFISCNELFTGELLKIIIEAPKSIHHQLNFSVKEPTLFILLLALFSLPLIVAKRPQEISY